jgi:ProP effector
MSKLTLHGDALKVAAARLGIPAPEEPKQPPVTVTPQEARRRRRAAINELWSRLAEEYPAAIAPRNHAPLHPLKIGIDRDIRERYPDVSLRTREGFLRGYVGHPGYLRLLKPDAVRVDLDGNPAGIISEDQAQNADERLAQLAERKKRRDGGTP